ncbi:hypothetical protein BDV95DRAFT_588794 [Massariosphaeria phaeospora]|uniref:Uncharacterized protein n=1 Tax=Massariosphaeria phaeospora TaxID=100035 RepID=A0A7C8MDG4_9PLEO|nr:hypothetical protein BDV95DRAFT_588794 [Massariosphaeria phaeospora]
MASTNSTPLFLKLPAELRNMIYEYALTEQVPLFATPHNANRVPKLYVAGGLFPQPPDIPFEDWARGFEVNQLRYVCRQMHDETRGLALALNNLTFHGRKSGGRTGSRQFEDFLECISSISKNYIHNVTILDERTRHPMIYDFCRQHPASRVIIRYATAVPATTGFFSRDPTSWLALHCALRQMFRGDPGVTLVPHHRESQRFDRCCSKLRLNSANTGNRGPFLDNFRLTLSQLHPDELYPVAMPMPSDDEAAVNVRVEQIRQLFEIGC